MGRCYCPGASPRLQEWKRQLSANIKDLRTSHANKRCKGRRKVKEKKRLEINEEKDEMISEGAEKVEKQEMLMAVVGGDSDVVVHIGKITIAIIIKRQIYVAVTKSRRALV
ncbi:unnamed protein product [Brugia pahangi]|uniref:Uncharacterized protein n=1 Tax=Brugia pahangi TaxID=6280 RepID=A0A0N4TVT2_BRUPA|nr:unnamed protein product [Brugia pahangi]